MLLTKIRTIVSKNHRRYKNDHFDLDLSYIRPNLIAMGIPAQNYERIYRNNVEDVVDFLEAKHKGHYKIYNLSPEIIYSHHKFHGPYSAYPIKDHEPPKFNQIAVFNQDVDQWLNQDANNVAVVHCKAGKGRTGVMICCYLLYSKFISNAKQAMNFFAHTRTIDSKGITIPSQKRYVKYYDLLLKSNLPYKASVVYFVSLAISSEPQSPFSDVKFKVFYSTQREFTSPNLSFKKEKEEYEMPVPLRLQGDFQIAFYSTTFLKRRLFKFWLNTFFIDLDWNEDDTIDKEVTYFLRSEGVDKNKFYNLFLRRKDLDKVTLRMNENFAIELKFMV